MKWKKTQLKNVIKYSVRIVHKNKINKVKKKFILCAFKRYDKLHKKMVYRDFFSQINEIL